MHFSEKGARFEIWADNRRFWRGLGVLPESALELADRVLLFYSEPVSATVVGASFLVKLQHFPLRIVELSSPLLEAPLKLDRAFHAAKLQHHPYHSEETLSSPEPKSRVIKPESHPTLKRRHSASGSSQETVRTRFRTREPSPRNLWPTNRQSSLRDDRDSFEILSSDKHTEGRAGRDHPIDDSEWSERGSSRAS